jgi:hypothetical protein
MFDNKVDRESINPCVPGVHFFPIGRMIDFGKQAVPGIREVYFRDV